jgi:prepilin-type N-terminal cleavage/methylation domain-containing protein
MQVPRHSTDSQGTPLTAGQANEEMERVMSTERRIKGFTLIELLVVIAIIALLIAILLPGLGEARRIARTVVCSAGLQQYGVGTQSYSADHQDRIWGFTWNRGRDGRGEYHMAEPNLHHSVLIPGGVLDDNMSWSARQAVYIMRHRGDRSGVRYDGRQPITLITGWSPHHYYSHLVLNDYLAQRLPEPMVTCPEDRNRLRWASDVTAFDLGVFAPDDPPGGSPSGGPNTRKRWPYSSSYVVTTAAWEGSPPAQRIAQISHGTYYPPPANQAHLMRLGNRLLSDVVAPSQKVHQYDMVQRHFGKNKVPWVVENHRQPLSFFDGSVVVRSNYDANKGWRRNQVGGTPAHFQVGTAQWFGYSPQRFEEGAAATGWGFYRFTAGGLYGYDFGGRELQNTLLQ